MELKKVVGDGQLFWHARFVWRVLPTQKKIAGQKSYSLYGHFSITIGPHRPIRSRPVDSFGNNRMKAEKQENCPEISPKSYVGILLIWTNEY
jgi:hypothetical protein